MTVDEEALDRAFTALGDPVEIAALTEAYRLLDPDPPARRPTRRAGARTRAGVAAWLGALGIVVLLLFFFAGGSLPAQFPDQSPGAYIVAAVVATALFVLSLLAHEVGHAVLAAGHGIAVEGIPLWLPGGGGPSRARRFRALQGCRRMRPSGPSRRDRPRRPPA